MKKILLLLGLTILFGGLVTAYLLYNKPHRDIRKTEVAFWKSVEELGKEFETDGQLSLTKYTDKVILTSGLISSISDTGNGPVTIVIKDGNHIANCEMDPLFEQDTTRYTSGYPIMVKGLFVGYDDLLGEIQLKKCSIESQN